MSGLAVVLHHGLMITTRREAGAKRNAFLTLAKRNNLMKTATSFCGCLAAALLFMLSSAGIGAAQCSGDESLGYNVCFGTGALGSDSSTSGANSAFGYEALYNNTTGDNNTAAGEEALWSNSTGNVNTATGVDALYSNTDGGD